MMILLQLISHFYKVNGHIGVDFLENELTDCLTEGDLEEFVFWLDQRYGVMLNSSQEQSLKDLVLKRQRSLEAGFHVGRMKLVLMQ